jgi:hypothetical protein
LGSLAGVPLSESQATRLVKFCRFPVTHLKAIRRTVKLGKVGCVRTHIDAQSIQTCDQIQTYLGFVGPRRMDPIGHSTASAQFQKGSQNSWPKLLLLRLRLLRRNRSFPLIIRSRIIKTVVVVAVDLSPYLLVLRMPCTNAMLL